MRAGLLHHDPDTCGGASSQPDKVTFGRVSPDRRAVYYEPSQPRVLSFKFEVPLDIEGVYLNCGANGVSKVNVLLFDEAETLSCDEDITVPLNEITLDGFDGVIRLSKKYEKMHAGRVVFREQVLVPEIDFNPVTDIRSVLFFGEPS